MCALGRAFRFVQAVLEHSGESQRIIAEAVRAAGRIDILVNNAGLIRRDDALTFSETDWDAALDVNLKTPFFLSQAAARVMLEAGREDHQHRVDVVISGRDPDGVLPPARVDLRG